MAHWLIKTEPSDYSFAQLLREKRTKWSGVKNALARIHLRAMKTGDEVLVYHTGDEKAVVGLAKVAAADGVGGEPVIAGVKALPRAVRLGEIKADPRFKDWALVKIGRLSVVPTTAAQFAAIQKMALAHDTTEPRTQGSVLAIAGLRGRHRKRMHPTAAK